MDSTTEYRWKQQIWISSILIAALTFTDLISVRKSFRAIIFQKKTYFNQTNYYHAHRNSCSAGTITSCESRQRGWRYIVTIFFWFFLHQKTVWYHWQCGIDGNRCVVQRLDTVPKSLIYAFRSFFFSFLAFSTHQMARHLKSKIPNGWNSKFCPNIFDMLVFNRLYVSWIFTASKRSARREIRGYTLMISFNEVTSTQHCYLSYYSFFPSCNPIIPLHSLYP